MKWVFIGWAALVLVVGVLVTVVMASQPSEEEEAAAAAAQAERAKEPPADLTDTATIVRRVQELRGLQFSGPVPEVEAVPAAQLQQQLTQLDSTAEQQETPDEQGLTTAAQLAFAQAGAIEPDAAQQLTSQQAVPGLQSAFVPEESKVLVDRELAESDPQTAEMLIAYELARGLEEQSFEEQLPRRARPFRDDENARIAVQEGAAALLAEQYAVEHFGASDPVEPNVADVRETEQGPEIPPAVQSLSLFPVRAGRDLVEGIHADGGWDAVDAAHGEPPATTRQVLNPAADETDAPPAPTLEVQDALGEGWQTIASAGIGELDLVALLTPGAGAGPASQAADGWRTGRLEVFGRGQQAQSCPPPCRKQSVSVLVVRWVDEDQATEFASTVRQALESGLDAEREGGRGWTIDDGGAALVRAGRFTSLVFAADAPVAGEIAEASLEG